MESVCEGVLSGTLSDSLARVPVAVAGDRMAAVCRADCKRPVCAADFDSQATEPDSAAADRRVDEDVRGVPCTVSRDSGDPVTRDDDDRARPCEAAAAGPVPFAPSAGKPADPDKAPGTAGGAVPVPTVAGPSPLRPASAKLCPDRGAASLALEQSRADTICSGPF